MNDAATYELSAQELMSDYLLCVYEGWSIQRLAQFFIEHAINGAPVMDADDQLVGAVSVSDVFKFENASETVKEAALLDCYRDTVGVEIPLYNDLKQWTHTAQSSCTVSQIMNDYVISVDISRSQAEVALLLVENHIHRVFVTDCNRVVGVISSTDLLRTMLPSREPQFAVS